MSVVIDAAAVTGPSTSHTNDLCAACCQPPYVIHTRDFHFLGAHSSQSHDRKMHDGSRKDDECSIFPNNWHHSVELVEQAHVDAHVSHSCRPSDKDENMDGNIDGKKDGKKGGQKDGQKDGNPSSHPSSIKHQRHVFHMSGSQLWSDPSDSEISGQR